MNAANLISILESTAHNMGITLDKMEVCVELKDGWQYHLDYYKTDGDKKIYLVTKE